jgi:hypothetical protein
MVPWCVLLLLAGQAPRPSDIEFSSARGLEFLRKQQRSDGSFRDTPYQVAAQGLAGLAFLSSGHTPQHGTYAVELRLGLRRLLAYQREDGYFDDRASRMYGHGFAALYLAQVLGMWGAPREEAGIRESLKRAIQLIEISQDPSGGWDYDPQPGGVSDCSVTVCQTFALRAARNIGLAVDKGVVDRALAYIRKAQAENGGFRYRIGDRGALVLLDQVTVGCSAAGVCILNGLGEYDSDRVRKGIAYLRENYRTPSTLLPFFYYTHYYMAQAFHGSRGSAFDEYYAFIARALLDLQETDGSWDCREAGVIPTTAMAVFILNVPTAVLPIIQR